MSAYNAYIHIQNQLPVLFTYHHLYVICFTRFEMETLATVDKIYVLNFRNNCIKYGIAWRIICEHAYKRVRFLFSEDYSS